MNSKKQQMLLTTIQKVIKSAASINAIKRNNGDQRYEAHSDYRRYEAQDKDQGYEAHSDKERYEAHNARKNAKNTK